MWRCHAVTCVGKLKFNVDIVHLQVQSLHGSLHLVDLAGSERLAKSMATGI